VLLLVNVAFVTAVTIWEAYSSIKNVSALLVGFGTVALLMLFAGMIPLVGRATAGGDTRRNALYGAVPGADQDDDAGEPCQPPRTEGPSHRAATHIACTRSVTEANKGDQFHELDDSLANGHLNRDPLSVNLKKVELWLMCFVSFAVWGCGTVVSSNSTQIFQALDFSGYDRSLDSVYVSIYGVASALGRVVVGFADDALKARHMHVAHLFPIAPIINTIGIPLFFILPAKGLIVAFFACGLATGVTWGSTVLIIKNIFAPDNCGKHYNVLYVAGMLTPLVMNVALFGPLYDARSEELGMAATHTCSGYRCIDVPLFVSLALNVLAIPCAVMFVRRIVHNGGSFSR
jgi:hypothetical protein